MEHYVNVKKLPAYISLLDIIRAVYEEIESDDTQPIEAELVPCNGIGNRHYKYSLRFSPDSWAPGVHDANITFFDKDLNELVNIRIRIETNLHEIYINVNWDALEWLGIIKEALDAYFLDFAVSVNIRPEIKTT